jgi:DNA-damage-inducible protein D
MLETRGIRPEDLPPEEDIKKLKRRVKAEEKRLEQKIEKFPSPSNKPNSRKKP